ncbi:dihydroneopterin aldolase [Actibacterium pelagium]|uniref:Diguanylate cyclase n=1 Tax=Actibacterium pelagium TaxID=2029103 RepID=A0A917EK83_9RHOB|nr:dihydroneopterin aldolase [Actibacterium pelagium]GGE47741.1 diguanylate cyclase [Actibacterium pelagium]
MTDEIRLAFAHPDARAQASTDSVTPPDRISLRDYEVEVEIGAFQSERGATQRVRFNIVVEVRPAPEPLNDDVDRILSYDTITDAIHSELSSERLNLLETLSERIADYILTEPLALRVFVRIEKLDRGPGALGVEIVRQREAEKPRLVDEDPHHWVAPAVVFLTNEGIAHPDLPKWLDRLEAREVPVILAVGPADQPAPQAGHMMAQRRIDLLAIEQNAWVLAGQDDRCVVTQTRTELDWATKHGQMVVWAPSKMVLDAVDGPSAQPRDTQDLMEWFAGQVHAEELVVIGAEAPATSALPVRAVSLKDAAQTL